MAEPDPRVQLAAERTLLAWIRTGLAVMALGYIINRHGGIDDAVQAALGFGLIVAGVSAIGLSAWLFHRFYALLDSGTHIQRLMAAWSVWFAVVVALIGAALVVALIAHPPIPLAMPPVLPAPTGPR